MRMTIHSSPKQHLWVWLLWLVLFYGVWGAIVFGNDLWSLTK
jgi:hypothetical protein